MPNPDKDKVPPGLEKHGGVPPGLARKDKVPPGHDPNRPRDDGDAEDGDESPPAEDPVPTPTPTPPAG